jgi:hypothetical protein
VPGPRDADTGHRDAALDLRAASHTQRAPGLGSPTHGFRNSDATSLAELEAALAEGARAAPSVDDLVRQAERWLYERSIILPGERVLHSVASRSFDAQEQQALAAVPGAIPPAHLNGAIMIMFCRRRGRIGGTILEWLRTPPGRHGATTMRDTSEKGDLAEEAWHAPLGPVVYPSRARPGLSSGGHPPPAVRHHSPQRTAAGASDRVLPLRNAAGAHRHHG